jgi:hypothetical protein
VAYAAGGFFHILRDGEIRAERDFRAPRSAVGISADGRSVILLVADGRQPRRSVGLTAYETAAWLRFFGASEGLLLDGGSSSALAVRESERPSESAVRLLNRPTSPLIPGVEGAVANQIAVFVDAGEGTTPTDETTLCP